MVGIVAIVGIVIIVSVYANNNVTTGSAAGGISGKPSRDVTDDTVSSGNKGGWQVNGKHYNLNIIGAKNVGDVGDSSGHTMFVRLNGKTKILMTQDPTGTFDVVDRDGTDGRSEFNIAPGHYNIYARALGKPGGKTKIDAWGEFEDATGEQLVLLGFVNIERSKGKPRTLNINELFYVDVTLCLSVDAETGLCTQEVVYTDYWVFDIDELLEYYWDYTNDGLKLLQVRFYECTLDPSAQASDYCRWGDGTAIDSTKTIIEI